MKKSLKYYQTKVQQWKQDSHVKTMQYKTDFKQIYKNHLLMLNDKYYNQIHLSAYSGLVNDPNGLAFYQEEFHIFYQWSPFVPIHQNKHWGYYTTNDFVNYQNHHLALAPELPEELDGVYSGGGLVVGADYYVYWTGNVRQGNQNQAPQNSSFILVGQVKDHKITQKKVLFEMDHQKYTRHFRDPKPISHSGKFYLLIGAQKIDKTSTIVVYQSNFPDHDFTFYGEIKILGKEQDFGYMIECPDYFQIANVDVLLLSVQGKKSFANKKDYDLNDDQSFFAIGKLNWERLTFTLEQIQPVDLGLDFYAPQMFSNSKRPILLAWAGTPQAIVYPTIEQMWAHNLTLPRELSYQNEQIIQQPLEELKKLRISKELKISKDLDLNEGPIEVFLKPRKDSSNFIIRFWNNDIKNQTISLTFVKEKLIIDQNDIIFSNPSEQWIRKIPKLEKLQLFIDHSLIEVFINDGVEVFTTKYHIEGKVKASFWGFEGFYYKLAPITMAWNDHQFVEKI